MTLSFLQAMIPGLSFRKDHVVTGVCDLGGGLQGIQGVKEKSRNLRGSHFKTLVLPEANEQVVSGEAEVPKDIHTVGVTNLVGVLRHMVIGADTGT